MDKQPKIGIVTVLYNSETVLEEFFATLNTQTFSNFVLYVIDNNSPDNSLNLTKELSKSATFKVKIIECKENYGVAKGNNVGIKQALEDACDMVLLSNNDVVLQNDTIEKLVEGKNEHKASMAVPKIYFHGTNLIWCAGGDFKYINANNRHFGYHQNDSGQFEKACKINYAPTCFMLIDKEVFDRVGFMDEKYFVYFDDTDFVFRAKKKGELLYYIPESLLWHKESTSTGGAKSDFVLYYFNRNVVYYTLKNHSIIQNFVAFCFYTAHLILRKPFTMSFRQFKLALKAHLDGIKIYFKK